MILELETLSPSFHTTPTTGSLTPSTCEKILKSHSLSSLLNYLRAFGDGPVAGVPGGQGIESWSITKSARVAEQCDVNIHSLGDGPRNFNPWSSDEDDA
ncbi:hypothetical protein TNCV_1908731 [Trichonephila clavipes]|nr:hypothetical protein TNCV_1908731 [Trichonephila clavipes]